MQEKTGGAGLEFGAASGFSRNALQTGFRITNANIGSFRESGSELALDVNEIDKTCYSLLVDLNVGLDRQQAGAWTIAPVFSLGYERILNSPRVYSTGTLHGFGVSQRSAFHRRDTPTGIGEP